MTAKMALKALGQRILCYACSLCRPVLLPTQLWGFTKWDGTQGDWLAKPVWSCWRVPQPNIPWRNPLLQDAIHPIFTWAERSKLAGEGEETSMDPGASACLQGYMKPLKQPENSLLCDPSLVDEIFDQIPELLEHHEQFLEQIHDCVQNWHEKQKVGDLLVQSVGPGGVIPPRNAGVPTPGHRPRAEVLEQEAGE